MGTEPAFSFVVCCNTLPGGLELRRSESLNASRYYASLSRVLIFCVTGCLPQDAEQMARDVAVVRTMLEIVEGRLAAFLSKKG